MADCLKNEVNVFDRGSVRVNCRNDNDRKNSDFNKWFSEHHNYQQSLGNVAGEAGAKVDKNYMVNDELQSKSYNYNSQTQQQEQQYNVQQILNKYETSSKNEPISHTDQNPYPLQNLISQQKVSAQTAVRNTTSQDQERQAQHTKAGDIKAFDLKSTKLQSL